MRSKLQEYGETGEYLDQGKARLEQEQMERAEKEKQFQIEMEQVGILIDIIKTCTSSYIDLNLVSTKKKQFYFDTKPKRNIGLYTISPRSHYTAPLFTQP